MQTTRSHDRRSRSLLLFATAMAFTACAPTEDTGSDSPSYSEHEWVVPSEGLPAEIEIQDANNNLDVVQHDDRIFLAFRTAPSHFASSETRLHVVSSTDEVDWRHEGTFHFETDIREPRFLSFDGNLFLYFALLGDEPAAFEPQGSRMTQYLEPGSWTEPTPFIELEDFIPWRTKMLNGVPTMIGYAGGGSIYDTDEGGLAIYWLKSTDGWNWEAAVEGQPIVDEGGGSETDLVLLDDGSLVAIERNEAGDENGFGSRICRAPANDLGNWTCAHDPKKYDSPLLFRQGNDVWLLGRRNVTETGHYDLGRDDLDFDDASLTYQIEYWQTPKRCALWRVDPDTLTVEWELDLPSCGDTCFPGIIDLGAGDVRVYNYTSPPGNEDAGWLDGQTGETWIDRGLLHFPG